jgi:hypothetical protein
VSGARRAVEQRLVVEVTRVGFGVGVRREWRSRRGESG